MGLIMHQIMLTLPLLPPLKPMGQSWRGVGAEVCFIRNTNLVAVGVGDINLALRKPATESSIDMGAEVCFIRNTNLVVA
jgi:energy-converting hydrogenase Eha subunit A